MKRFTRMLVRLASVGTTVALVGGAAVATTPAAYAAEIDPEAYYQLVARHSGKAIEVANGSTADAATVVQRTTGTGQHQQFQLVEVGGTTQPPPPAGPPQPMPVSGNIDAHDPSMIRTGSGYVVFSTHNGVQTRTSPDRSRFTRTAAAIPGGATWAGQYNGGDPNFIWAPDVSFHNGTYWLYYSVSTFGSNRSAVGLATSSTGQPGSFTDQGMVIDSAPSDNYNAIDPSLLVDAAGSWWLVFGSWWSGIKMVQLDPATGKRHPANQTLYSVASRPDTQIEGPDIVRNGEHYYLFVAWGRCCRGVDSTYQIRVGRSTSPTGPFLDRDGVSMQSGGGTSVLASHGRVIGPGGADVLADTDGDLLVYHYYDGQANGAVRLGLNRISWVDGWPVLVQ